MEKAEIQKLVNSNSDRITTYESDKGKSAVWKSFKLIRVDDVPVAYVKCEKCQTILKWKSRDGTSGLSAHVDFCMSQSPVPQKSLLSYTGFSARTTSTSTVPAVVKSELADSIVNMCAKDIRFDLFLCIVRFI